MRVPACPPRPLLCQRAARNLHLESSFQPSSSVALLESRLWTTAAFIQNSKALAPAGAAGALLQYRQDKREINFVPCFENVYVLLDDAGDSGELRRVALEARTSGARRWRRRRRLQWLRPGGHTSPSCATSAPSRARAAGRLMLQTLLQRRGSPCGRSSPATRTSSPTREPRASLALAPMPRTVVLSITLEYQAA